MAQNFKLKVLKRALDVLPDGPSNITEFTESLRNPQGEKIARANIYQVCRGVLNLEWLENEIDAKIDEYQLCLLYTSPSPRDRTRSRMPSSA